MEFVQVLSGYDHLWAVKSPDKEVDELTDFLMRIKSPDYLLDFFMDNLEDLQSNFHIELIGDAIDDTIEDALELQREIMTFPETEYLDEIFVPLGSSDLTIQMLTREKARNWDRPRHASWVRIYAIRLEPNVFIVTGGAIKLTRAMQDRPHTQQQLDNLNACRDYLMKNGVFDQDSFIDYKEED